MPHGLKTAVTIAVILAAGGASAREVHVSVDGDDGNPGSREKPFRTLGRAAATMGPGDVCRIGGGTYREVLRPSRSGEPGSPIRFAAEEGAEVTLSGTGLVVAPWDDLGNGVWSTPCDGPIDQVFAGDVMLFEARWPNAVPGKQMEAPRAAAGTGTGYDGVADPSLPDGDWSGALVRIWPGDRWTNSTRRVLDYEAGKSFRFNRDFRPESVDKYHQHDPFLPRAGNPYVLFGVRDALDAPGEWFFDSEKARLLLIPPDGRPPAQHVIEVKRRKIAVNLDGLSHIHVEGVRVFGAGVSMEDAKECAIRNCRIFYADHFRESDKYTVPAPSNSISGVGNEMRDCLIAYSAGTGLQLRGRDNQLVNSIVHDTNYTGSNAAALCMNDSEGTVIRQCSIFRSGRGLIRHYRVKRVRIEFNDLHHANLLTNDCGATYAWGTDGEGSVIAYNWVHDNTGDHTMGIYLDNFCSNFLVHHNVLWNQTSTGIRLNSDATDHLVANNTVIQSPPFGVFTYAGRTPTQKGTRIVNNLVIGRLSTKDPRQFVQGGLAPVLANNLSAAIDARGVPTSDSKAVDAGIEVAGITDGFAGAAPDVGAYERGGEHWRPGVDWGDVASRPDLAFRPLPSVSDASMIAEGLVLWLDAARTDTLMTRLDGGLEQWGDRSGQGHDAVAGAGLTVVENGLNGNPVVRGAGTGSLTVGAVRKQAGPMSFFVVCAGPVADGEGWQRVVGSWSGKGEEWIKPNWAVIRPGGESPIAFGPRLFYKEERNVVLDNLTVGGSSSGGQQYLAADIAEVLLFNRVLRFDEQAVLESYLQEKWGIH